MELHVIWWLDHQVLICLKCLHNVPVNKKRNHLKMTPYFSRCGIWWNLNASLVEEHCCMVLILWLIGFVSAKWSDITGNYSLGCYVLSQCMLPIFTVLFPVHWGLIFFSSVDYDFGTKIDLFVELPLFSREATIPRIRWHRWLDVWAAE